MLQDAEWDSQQSPRDCDVQENANFTYFEERFNFVGFIKLFTCHPLCDRFNHLLKQCVAYSQCCHRFSFSLHVNHYPLMLLLYSFGIFHMKTAFSWLSKETICSYEGRTFMQHWQPAQRNEMTLLKEQIKKLLLWLRNEITYIYLVENAQNTSLKTMIG